MITIFGLGGCRFNRRIPDPNLIDRADVESREHIIIACGNELLYPYVGKDATCKVLYWVLRDHPYVQQTSITKKQLKKIDRTKLDPYTNGYIITFIKDINGKKTEFAFECNMNAKQYHKDFEETIVTPIDIDKYGVKVIFKKTKYFYVLIKGEHRYDIKFTRDGKPLEEAEADMLVEQVVDAMLYDYAVIRGNVG